MAAVYNNDAGTVSTPNAVNADFDLVTGSSVSADSLVIAVIAGWCGDATDGASIDDITDNQSNDWEEAVTLRKTGLNHTLSVWFTVAAGGSIITATAVPTVPSAVSKYNGVIFSFSGMDGTLEQAAVTNDQGTNVTTIQTGNLTNLQADVVLIAAGFPVADSFGTITKDDSEYVQIAESEGSEPFSALYRIVSAISTYETSWSLGFTSQYGPISALLSFPVTAGGGSPTLLKGTITLLGVGL
jgi:hypothetical protein